MPETDRAELRRKIARYYERHGMSVREIAQAQSMSYGKVHKLLLEEGVTMRPRGGDNKGRR